MAISVMDNHIAPSPVHQRSFSFQDEKPPNNFQGALPPAEKVKVLPKMTSKLALVLPAMTEGTPSRSTVSPVAQDSAPVNDDADAVVPKLLGSESEMENDGNWIRPLVFLFTSSNKSLVCSHLFSVSAFRVPLRRWNGWISRHLPSPLSVTHEGAVANPRTRRKRISPT